MLCSNGHFERRNDLPSEPLLVACAAAVLIAHLPFVGITTIEGRSVGFVASCP
jgi:hypothetical protein